MDKKKKKQAVLIAVGVGKLKGKKKKLSGVLKPAKVIAVRKIKRKVAEKAGIPVVKKGKKNKLKAVKLVK